MRDDGRTWGFLKADGESGMIRVVMVSWQCEELKNGERWWTVGVRDGVFWRFIYILWFKEKDGWNFPVIFIQNASLFHHTIHLYIYMYIYMPSWVVSFILILRDQTRTVRIFFFLIPYSYLFAFKSITLDLMADDAYEYDERYCVRMDFPRPSSFDESLL